MDACGYPTSWSRSHRPHRVVRRLDVGTCRRAVARSGAGHAISAGIGLGEFRLRTGFMHVPVPGLAFNRAATVRAIGESAAMRPWRLDTAYDRPIPRRLTEESGVPRTVFGVEKQFTATQARNLHEIAPTLFAMQWPAMLPPSRTGRSPAAAGWPPDRLHRGDRIAPGATLNSPASATGTGLHPARTARRKRACCGGQARREERCRSCPSDRRCSGPRSR